MTQANPEPNGDESRRISSTAPSRNCAACCTRKADRRRRRGFDAVAGSIRNNGVIMNIPVDVQIVLGSAEMPVSELMALQKGSTVALNRRIGEPVDVMVNGRRIAKGEITVLEHDPSRFGIRLTEIITAAKTA